MATTIVTAYKLTKAFNIYPIFKDVSFQIMNSEKIALVGVNGAGKSTLMRMIAREERPDTGEIVLQRGLKISYLPQEATFDSSQTLYAELMGIFAETIELQRQIADLEGQMAHANGNFELLMEEYAVLTHRFEQTGGYDFENRIERVLIGLNFPREMWEQPLNSFSGGQKTRAALARALIAQPDLLLLDEPTNHLDLKTLEWLEDFLSGWDGAVLVISHDRFFLDRVVSKVLDLSFGRMEEYVGNYTKYLSQRTERLERYLEQYDAQQAHIAKTEDFIRRYKAGQRSKQARGRQKLLNRLDRIERPRERDKLHLALKSELRSGKLVLATEDLEVGYIKGSEQKVLFAAPNLEVMRGERVAIVGPNGAGKSTFLKTIMGEIPPLAGEVDLGPSVQVGYYAQSHEGLNFENNILEEILWAHPMTEGEARGFLGRFMFSGDDVFKKVGTLSGGERSRVALAKLTLTRANFLILDEPTNHLDIQAREALEDVLSEHNGTILMVSHDRYFIDALATQVWSVEKGSVTVTLGNYTDFVARSEQLREEAMIKQIESVKAKAAANLSIEQRQIGKSSNRDERQRQRKISQMEELIAKKETRLAEITNTMNFELDYQSLTKLSQEYQNLTNEIEALYAEYGALAG